MRKKNTEYIRWYRQRLKETDPKKYKKIFLGRSRKKYWEKKNKKILECVFIE